MRASRRIVCRGDMARNRGEIGASKATAMRIARGFPTGTAANNGVDQQEIVQRVSVGAEKGKVPRVSAYQRDCPHAGHLGDRHH